MQDIPFFYYDAPAEQVEADPSKINGIYVDGEYFPVTLEPAKSNPPFEIAYSVSAPVVTA